MAPRRTLSATVGDEAPRGRTAPSDRSRCDSRAFVHGPGADSGTRHRSRVTTRHLTMVVARLLIARLSAIECVHVRNQHASGFSDIMANTMDETTSGTVLDG